MKTKIKFRMKNTIRKKQNKKDNNETKLLKK